MTENDDKEQIKEKDIHSGLIGPLIICKTGTLDKDTSRPLDAREFTLLFMTFEEEKSWYFDKNSKKMCTDEAKKSSDGVNCHTFHAINGITYNLQGFNMHQSELVRWHMLNMGGSKDIHVINFHGQTMTERINSEFRHPAYPLMPGTFATVEMKPARAGIWLLNTEVAEYQQAGMQTLFNVAEEDESRLTLSTYNRCDRVWRRRGERSAACNILQHDQFSSGSVIVWGGISLEGHTALHVLARGSVTAIRYRDEILRPLVRPYAGAVGPRFLLMQDNARPHVAGVCQQFLQDEGIEAMDWPTRSPDLNPLEHLWDIMSCTIHQCQVAPQTVQELADALVQVWEEMPQETVRRLIRSMPRHWCNFPVGMASRIISDEQITASHYIDPWEPKLARLNNVGSYNAWNAHLNRSSLPWIQVDLQKIFLLSGIQTQGASKYFTQFYIKEFFVAYSKDNRKWNVFKGNSTATHKFPALLQSSSPPCDCSSEQPAPSVSSVWTGGNSDSHSIKENLFDPPIPARYIRVFPTRFQNQPVLRMELLGCEIQGCSAPLGMENYNIKDAQITASSHKTSYFSSSWLASLARLNKAGSVNAWQAKSNNNQQWLQIDFLVTKKITGVMTQGPALLQSYIVQYSDNGKDWKSYMDTSTSMDKIFQGNRNSQGYAKNEFHPPIYSRYLRIIPKIWNQSIVMRLEVYGCDT
ncbi:unnamed protein product [Ranitomeya imitator]|uniref:F5/8 type C domain-containing protein n=1 Tax=Ranitomeya imitator TaxID=111125 RepID=A0ABN9MA83_9NEOB|nr:unnamed protein product [Ranitomeya imitator]